MSRGYKFCPQCARELHRREAGGVQRAVCPDADCGYVHWDNPVPVVAAIVEHEGKIILARNVAWPGRFFALITGFLERGESPETGVVREVEEELGLTATAPPGFVGVYHFERMNQLILAYHVAAAGTIVLNEELAEYKAIAPEKLRPWPAATGLALRDWMLSRGLRPPEDNLSLGAIRNFLQLDERLATAGQPSAEQLLLLRTEGYTQLINLALPNSDHALPDEAALAARLGLRYHHIPVDFSAPSLADLDRFFAVMDAAAGEKVFVHCAKNMRVSAFVFLWRVLRQGWPREKAAPDLHRIWQPDAVWQAFIDRALARGAQPTAAT